MYVLIVDDCATARRMIREALEPIAHLTILEAKDGEEGLSLLRQHAEIDLIFLDFNMPRMNGLECLQELRAAGYETPVIMVTTESERSRILEALRTGAVHYIIKPFSPKTLRDRAYPYLQRRSKRFYRLTPPILAKGELSEAQEFADLLTTHQHLLIGAIASLANAIDARDPYTCRHSANVAEMAYRVALHLGWNENEANLCRMAGLLHDVGKIGVPEAILGKTEALDEREYAVIRSHPEAGANILAPLEIPFPGLVQGVRHHHERWDGQGYPEGLAGISIPPIARVLAVCDTWDAMTSNRPYRKALAVEKALRILQEEAGRQFDPTVVEAFLAVVKQGQASSSSERECPTVRPRKE